MCSDLRITLSVPPSTVGWEVSLTVKWTSKFNLNGTANQDVGWQLHLGLNFNVLTQLFNVMVLAQLMQLSVKIYEH